MTDMTPIKIREDKRQPKALRPYLVLWGFTLVGIFLAVMALWLRA